jgi:hypothetical protein
MSFLYKYGTASNYESKRWSTVQNLLDQVKDNNANLIFANHVRDAVFTLWERISDVEIIAVSASSVSPYFQNSNPTTITVGGIPEGTTFSTPHTVQQMFDALLYPYVSPVLSLSTLSNKEYGQNLNSTLSWNVTKKSNIITSIVVDGQIFIPTGYNQSGTKLVTGTWSTPEVYTTNTFTMVVGDDSTTITTINTSFDWMNKIYWGSLDLTSILNPNLTEEPILAPSITINSSIILGLTGAGVGTGNVLSKIKDKTYTNINGAGNYLLFAWPSNVPNATSPVFTVNGLQNTGFTNLKTGWSFTNIHGVMTNYEVWISNTAQNSPLNIIIS